MPRDKMIDLATARMLASVKKSRTYKFWRNWITEDFCDDVRAEFRRIEAHLS